MKTVVSPEMVAHLWAHQSQEHARNHQGNIYFHGRWIYSYGGHFPIACHATGAHGHKAILLTTDTYSNTTAKHVADVRYAIRDRENVFHVPLSHIADWIWNDRKAKTRVFTEIWKTYMTRIDESLLAASKARKYGDQHRSRALGLVNEANAFSQFFGLRHKLTDDLQAIADGLEKDRARLARSEAKRLKDQAKRNEQDRKERATKRAELLTRWLAGESVHLPHSENGDTNHLRIVGDTVETDRGAEFPVSHARRAFSLIRECRESKTPFVTNGHSIHLGHFTIDAVDADGTVKAGCHTVKYEEIVRIARQLELL